MSQGAEPFEAALVARYSRNNALGFSLLTIAYLVRRGLSVEDWATSLGSDFAGPATNWVPGMSASDMAREAALEIVSCKGRLVELTGDTASAAATVEWPPERDLQELGLSRDQIAPFWNVWHPIASSVGLTFAFESTAKATTLRFARRHATES